MLNTAIVGLGWWGKTLVKAARDFGAPIRFLRGVSLEPDTVRDFAAEHKISLGTSFNEVLADSQVGSLTPGKQADIIMLRADDLAMFPVTDPVASVVMQGGTAQVDTVLVAGRIVKRGGKLLYNGLADKKAALRKSGARILTDFGLLPREAA